MFIECLDCGLRFWIDESDIAVISDRYCPYCEKKTKVTP